MEIVVECVLRVAVILFITGIIILFIENYKL